MKPNYSQRSARRGWAASSLTLLVWAGLWVSVAALHAEEPPRFFFNLDASVVPGGLNDPRGVAVDSSNNVYVADTGNHRIVKFTQYGGYLTQWGTQGNGAGQFNGPTGLAVDSSNTLCVADTGNSRIAKFTADGAFLFEWAAANAYQLATDSAGNLYALGTNSLVQKFGSDGTSLGPVDANRAVIGNGADNIYVSSYYGHSARCWNGWTYVNCWIVDRSDIDRLDLAGNSTRMVTGPVGLLAVDGSNNLYATDYSLPPITKLNSNGLTTAQWGISGSYDGQFGAIGGAAVSHDGNLVYVADSGNNRVQVFAYDTSRGPARIVTENWKASATPSTDWYAVTSSADGTQLAATDQSQSGRIYISRDSGATWTVTSAPPNYWGSIASSADGRTLVAAAYGPVYVSSDSGTNWSLASLPNYNSSSSYSFASSADGTRWFAVGAGAYGSMDSGATWSLLTNAPGGSAVACSADGNKVVLARNEAVYASTNAGVTWALSTAPRTIAYSALASSADGTKIVAAGGYGICTSTDSGATWTSNNLAVANFTSVAASADGRRLMAATYGGPIYTSADAGVTWSSNSAPNLEWTSVAASADGRKLVGVAFNSPIYTWQPTMPASQTVPAGTDVTLSVVALGALPLTYQWECDGTNLPWATNATLTLTNVPLASSFGSLLSTNALITVLPAVATTQPVSGISATGDAVLHGSVWLGASPTLAWFEWGTGTNYGNIAGVTTISASGLVGLRSPLSGLSESSVYHFRFVAWNNLGLVYGNDQTFVEGLLPTVVTLQATGITTSGVTLNASINPGGPDTTAYFRWGTSTNYTQVTAVNDLGAGASALTFSLPISGLNSAAGYHYQAVASNLLGTVFGPDVPFLTAWRATAPDADGVTWHYVNAYNVEAGPSYFANPPVYSGIQAANLIFGNAATGHIYAISVANDFVTHTAHLDGWGDSQFLLGPGLDENYSYASGAGYDGAGYLDSAFSAYVLDHGTSSTNYVWEAAASAITSTNSPLTWTQAGGPQSYWVSWVSVASSADGTRLLAANGSAIYASTNGGATWAAANAPSANCWFVASSADGRKLAVAGYYSGSIFASTNSGVTWWPASAPITNWSAIASSADGSKLVALASGVSGAIYTSADSGATWQPSRAANRFWHAVATSADGRKLAAVTYSFDGIYTSTNFGFDWNQTTAPSNYWASLASSADGNQLVAGVNGGLIYVSTNSGADWQPTSAPRESWAAVASSADGSRLVAAASPGQIYTSKNAGATWTASFPAGPPASNWRSLCSSADGRRLVALVADGGVFTSQSIPTLALSIAASRADHVLSWTIPSMDFTLQQNPDLTTTNWTDVPTPPVLNLSNLQNQVIVSPTNGKTFYRLKH
jgi:sugar lactone lactonase YvrE